MIFKSAILLVVVTFVANSYSNAMALDNWRIVGGKDAAKDQFPHMVIIREYDYPICGGSIINDRWILTASHCVITALARTLQAIAGSNKLSAGGDKYQVELIVTHEKYNPSAFINDVALLKLEKPIQFSKSIKSLQLPTTNIKAGAVCHLSGWGTITFPGSEHSNDLQYITLSTISVEDCQRRHAPNPVSESELCTLTVKGEGACQGDSGSPLIIYENEEAVQIGIMTWGHPCGVGFPDVYTRVSYFTEWIMTKIN